MHLRRSGEKVAGTLDVPRPGQNGCVRRNATLLDDYVMADGADEESPLCSGRDQTYGLTRRVDLSHDDAKSALDFAVAWQAEQQAETSYQMSVAIHRLKLLVAFFFPTTTLTAIFGANLRHGLEK